MKHLLLTLLLTSPTLSFSQAVTVTEESAMPGEAGSSPALSRYAKSGTKAEEEATFGAKDEREYQEASLANSHHHHLVLYTGAKRAWLNEMSAWLQEEGLVPIGIKAVNGGERWTFRCPASKDSILTISAILNPAEARIRRLNITGPRRELIHLFYAYWEFPIGLSDLKPGTVFHRDYLGDRVAFDWKGKAPMISVFRRPEGYFLRVFPE